MKTTFRQLSSGLLLLGLLPLNSYGDTAPAQTDAQTQAPAPAGQAPATAPTQAATPAGTQTAAPVPTQAEAQTSAPTPVQAAAPVFSQQQIEQIVAPIALYPDALVAQILMASTYPLEIVAAARWSKDHPGLEGKALEDAVQSQKWDPSVKSLTAVPQVLQMLSDKLEQTETLGDAFLSQQKDVMEAIQRLRVKAQQAGHLQSGKQQVVRHVQEQGSSIIEIAPANPGVIYVPTYDPGVVYGTWAYPDYPPYSYYPPGYVAGSALIGFGVGLAVGSAIWGNCNWGGGGAWGVGVNVNNYNNFNRTNIHNGNWTHNPAHRGAVPYRGAAAQRQFGSAQRQSRATAAGALGGKTQAGSVAGRNATKASAAQAGRNATKASAAQAGRKTTAKSSAAAHRKTTRTSHAKHPATHKRAATHARARGQAHRPQARSASHRAGSMNRSAMGGGHRAGGGGHGGGRHR